MAILNNSNAISTGGYDINNSLRIRKSASAYLNRTPASAGNRKTYTWSGWVKRGELSTDQNIFSAGYTTGTFDANYLQFTSSNTLSFQNVLNASGAGQLATSAVFRDPSAWYHIVLVVDTTQATASDRAKLYVNGVQQTVTFTSNFTLNADTQVNNTSVHSLGRTPPDGFGGAAWLYFDGYLADVNLIDGQALTPSSFGETDTTTGVWKPKAYTGTYGTNGSYLKFSDIATTSGSNAGLGKDFSGNANYWTTNNISVTAGTTYDAMIDSPTLTSATVANYAVLNPLIPSTLTYSEANLTVQRTTSNWEATGSTISVSQGKWYAEFVWTAGTYAIIGVEDMDLVSTWDNEYIGYSANGRGYGWDGNVRNNASDSAYGSTFTTGDIIGVAIDMDNKFVYMSKNGVFQNSGVPTSGATGTGGLSLAGTNYIIGAAAYNATISANFGQRPFSYTPPTGFVRLNTFNLPDSTIKKGNTVMDATTYTGTGASLSVTNAGAFKPDFVWVKGRSGATDHAWYDSVRGTTKQIESNTQTAETTEATGLTAFGTSGFTVGALAQMNTSAATYVGWQWQAGQGSTTTGTGTGGITSVTQSVNATAGFSIVTYTGSGSNGTVTHGLGVAPKMIIVRIRNGTTNNWRVYNSSLTSAAYFLYLNGTQAEGSDSTLWNSTAPTSSVFSLGTNGDVNASTYNYVAYCWAEIAGFSKFGSYTGNGSTDGVFVYTGFRPKYVMVKRTNAVRDWVVIDSVRATTNVVEPQLFPNDSSAEDTTVKPADLLSNGFKLRTVDGSWNASGGTYIVMAFAENPFKNANAR